METPDSEPRSFLRRVYDAVPARLIIAVQCFTATWCGFMLRISLSLVLLAMVYPSKAEEKMARGIVLLPVKDDNLTTFHSESPLPDYGPQYNWSQTMQGQLLAAYFYGSVVAPFPGGVLSELWGSRLVVGVTSLASGALMLLCPVAADAGISWLIAIRVLHGVLGGALYPSLHCLVSQWAPPQEKSKFVWSLLGGNFGSVVTWPICSAIIETLGWKASFYIIGAVVCLWSVFWFVFVYDSPSDHPRITPHELHYITTSIGDRVSTHKSGGYASLPHLMRLLFGVVFGSVGDRILSDPSRNKTLVRKLFVIPSHFMPAALMAPLGYVGKNEALAVALLSLSLGFNGAAIVSNLSNHHDLAPNYAGSLYGIMNTVGTCAGFIFPSVVGHILEQGSTVQQWQIIFFIGSGLYFVSGLVFIFFGSAETQPWNFKEQEEATPS